MVKRRGPEINHFMPHSTQGCTSCCNLAAISVNQFTLPNPKGVSILQNPLLDRDSVDKGTLRAVEIGDHNRLFTPRQQAVVPGDGSVVNAQFIRGIAANRDTVAGDRDDRTCERAGDSFESRLSRPGSRWRGRVT